MLDALVARLGPWAPISILAGVAIVATLTAVILPAPQVPYINVAFIGNSMMYYNDFPRFMEALSDEHMTQNSCLHGDASLLSITLSGNGMYKIWGGKGNARVYDEDETIFDYGACTVPQLLFGYDNDLDQRMQDEDFDGNDDNDDYAITDDFFSYSDGLNPCYKDQYYYGYLTTQYAREGTPKYDFIVMNDNTRGPARWHARNESIQVLHDKYIDWFLETGAIPVFLCTYAYSTPYRDMGGLSSVTEFTSYTYEGYRLYAQILRAALPPEQRPRIAPVSVAFLVVWEENYSLWLRLFHVDKIHASPLGTYLQGCVMHHTLFGRMPRTEVALSSDISSLFLKVRRFQPGEHRRSPYPTLQEAKYLYEVAVRVCKHGYRPKSWHRVPNGAGVEYEPTDDLFRVDDLF